VCVYPHSHDTEWPIICQSAIKKLLTQSLFNNSFFIQLADC